MKTFIGEATETKKVVVSVEEVHYDGKVFFHVMKNQTLVDSSQDKGEAMKLAEELLERID